jgi:hypothetical protein
MSGHKLVLVWIVGALLMLGGSWIMGNLEPALGVTAPSYYLAVVAAFVLFLLAGLCWIAVANSTKSHWKL